MISPANGPRLLMAGVIAAIATSGCFGGPVAHHPPESPEATAIADPEAARSRLATAAEQHERLDAQGRAFIELLEERRAAGLYVPPHYLDPPASAGAPERPVHDEAKLYLHIQAASPSWRAGADQVHGCADVQSAMDAGDTDLDVVVFLAGIETVRALQIAIEHDDGVVITDWEAYDADDTMSIPSAKWPVTGGWLAVSWPNGRNATSGMHPVGRLRLRAGSAGDVRITAMPDQPNRIGAVQLVDGAMSTYYVDPTCGLGRATVGDPVGSPAEPCGGCG